MTDGAAVAIPTYVWWGRHLCLFDISRTKTWKGLSASILTVAFAGVVEIRVVSEGREAIGRSAYGDEALGVRFDFDRLSQTEVDVVSHSVVGSERLGCMDC